MSHNGETPNGEVPKIILDAHLKKVSTGISSPIEAVNLLSHSGIFKNEPLMNKILDYLVSDLEKINQEDRKKIATLLSQHVIFLNAKINDHPERAELLKKMKDVLYLL